MVEAMHGRIGYNDTAAVSATLYFALPLAGDGTQSENTTVVERQNGDRRRVPRDQ
jgi:hypothetical protein